MVLVLRPLVATLPLYTGRAVDVSAAIALGNVRLLGECHSFLAVIFITGDLSFLLVGHAAVRSHMAVAIALSPTGTRRASLPMLPFSARVSTFLLIRQYGINDRQDRASSRIEVLLHMLILAGSVVGWWRLDGGCLSEVRGDGAAVVEEPPLTSG